MRKSANPILLILIFLFGNALSIAAPTSGSSAGELELSNEQGQRKMALTLNTAIKGEVNGMVASLEIEQTFQNDSDDWVNGRYVFPLASTAAVDSLQIKVGERVINAVVQAKAEARKTFHQAKQAGKKAGLVEQHRANLFSISIANIAPHETVVARITVIDQVRYADNVFSLVLPTTLTPRYIPGAPIELTKAQQLDMAEAIEEDRHGHIDANTGWATNTNSVGDAGDITPPQSYRLGAQASHRFSLDLLINAGLDLISIDSKTHHISSREVNPKQYQLGLSNQTELMNQDLQLHWQAQLGQAPNAAAFQQQHDGAYYSMVMLTPPQVNVQLSLPRDVTFIIDSSGSMAGDSMQQAKLALRDGLTYLSPHDRFNIVDFDSDFHALFSASEAASEVNLRKAKTMVTELIADGGTEMMGALSFALQQPRTEQYLHQVIFITDGAIGNERELFKLISSQLADARLFTVGIGSAPNAYFMNKAAKFGRGSYTYIRNTRDVQDEIASLFNKITTPVMRDIKLNWSQAVEQFPQRIPDLYAGEPISVLVKSARPISQVTATGTLLDTPWVKRLKLTFNNTAATSKQNLDTVWARQKITELMDQLAIGEIDPKTAKQQITQLGISHSIVSKFTSLVAVEATPSKPEHLKPEHLKAKHKNIPSLMPHGSAMPIPQTASPAALLTIAGSLILILSGFISRRRLLLNANSPTSSSAPEA